MHLKVICGICYIIYVHIVFMFVEDEPNVDFLVTCVVQSCTCSTFSCDQ